MWMTIESVCSPTLPVISVQEYDEINAENLQYGLKLLCDEESEGEEKGGSKKLKKVDLRDCGIRPSEWEVEGSRDDVERNVREVVKNRNITRYFI